jgi:septal ring factor EnvC (AmiA/AmiB activator)
MSIRYLAVELYRCDRKISELEAKLAQLGQQVTPERGRLEVELFQAKKERDHYKALLDAKKEPPQPI